MAKEQFKIRELIKLTQEYFPINWLEEHDWKDVSENDLR